jgi:tRNA pseudouridine(54/55) synthase
MGGWTSGPKPPADIQKLLHAGVCKGCIMRLLSIGHHELSPYKISDMIFADTCSACSGVMATLPKIIENAKAAVDRYCFYEIQVELAPAILNRDDAFQKQLHCPSSCSLKNFIKARAMIALRRSKDGPLLRISIIDCQSVHAELRWVPLIISGRYFKRSRRVSHSRFMPGNPISSVEGELIAALTGVVPCSEMKFESAGREDMDVRMIGNGRPFIITCLNPLPQDDRPPPSNRSEFAASFADRLPSEVQCNYGVSAKGLQITADTVHMNVKHIKCYRCVVYCSVDVTPEMLDRLTYVENLVVQQRTPCRVAHRREMMFREKMVMKLAYRVINERFFILDLTTSSGTYIKEFVNSDFGRTVPSLGSIMDPVTPIECQLMQLDVVFVGD